MDHVHLPIRPFVFKADVGDLEAPMKSMDRTWRLPGEAQQQLIRMIQLGAVEVGVLLHAAHTSKDLKARRWLGKGRATAEASHFNLERRLMCPTI